MQFCSSKNLSTRRLSHFAGAATMLVILVANTIPFVAAKTMHPNLEALSETDDAEPIQLEVKLNGKAIGRWPFLRKHGALLATAPFFAAANLKPRQGAITREFQGDSWLSLLSVANLEVVHYFKESRLSLNLVSINANPVSSPPRPSLPVLRTDHRVETVTTTSSESPTPKLLALEISVNGPHEGNWLLLESQGSLYATREAVEAWRINQPAGLKSIVYRGQQWIQLTALPGFNTQLDAASQSMELTFQPNVFSSTRIAPPAEMALRLSKSITSLVANYDLNETVNFSKFSGVTRDTGAIVDLRLSGEFGVLSSSQLARSFRGAGESGRLGQRLETTYTRDFAEQNVSLRLGDTATRSGMMGRAVYFGGIQLSRNFQLTPGFYTQPVPIISGQSSAPSTVELYINDALRQTSQVPAGPFQIDNFSLLGAGSNGQAKVVVRDLLGRETVLVQDFFGRHDLLEANLSDWSLEAGAVRNNLGISSADYGARFGSAWWRYGITQAITLETHAEGDKQTRGAGAGASVALPAGFFGQLAIAGSRDMQAGAGRQWLLGIEQSGRRHGLSLRIEAASPTYRQIGVDSSAFTTRRQLSASYNYFNERLGQIGVNYARIDSFLRSPITTYSANYSLPLVRNGNVSLSFIQVLGATTAHSLALNFSIPIDKQVYVTSGINQHDHQRDTFIAASKSVSDETGIGWRALAGTLATGSHAEGGWYYQGSRGAMASDMSVFSGQKTARLGARGGLVFADGSVFATRRIDESFAVVDVPGYANVGVGFQSNALTRTDAEGKALVPRLQPFRSNSIRLNPNELPISAELDSIEQVVVPASRVGVKALFPVREGRGALIRIVLDDGSAAPAGAIVKVEGDDKDFFVARRGEAFVTGLKAHNTVSMNWNDQVCRIDVDLPPGSSEVVARVGPLRCAGISLQ